MTPNETEQGATRQKDKSTNEGRYELRIGRSIDASASDHGQQIADLIHARVPLSSTRIYFQAPRTYLLSVLPEGRSTLACMTIRLSSRPDLRAAAFVEWLTSPEVMAALDDADRHREVPLMVERVLPVMLHAYGDGLYFHTMMVNATRRRDILHPALETKAWDQAQLGYGVTLETNAKGEPVVRCHKQPFSIDGLRLRLNGARLLVPADEVAGRPLDEVIDDPRIAGCGLTVGRWIKQTGTPGTDHHLIDLKSDLMPVAEAAALVDKLRMRHDIRGVEGIRTPVRRHVAGYDPAPGVRPENPQIYNWDDRDEQGEMVTEIATAPQTESLADPVAAAILAEHGLADAYRDRLAREREGIRGEADPAFCLRFSQYGAASNADILTINLTPWLREASAEDIGCAIRSMFGRMDRDESVLLRMAQRCRNHIAGDLSPEATGIGVWLTPNRHDEARIVEVLEAVRPDLCGAAGRIMRFARTSRELEFMQMWSDFRQVARAA